MPEQKVHRSPRMSINAMAQYLVAPPARRERILKDQKYPPVFRARWYEHATRAIVRYLLDEDRNAEHLVDAQAKIDALPTPDKNAAQKVQDNREAVVAFRACCAQINFDTLKPERGPEQGNTVLEGVTLSVRPEIVLRGQYRNDDCSGAVKVYLSKNDRLGEVGAAAIGSVLHLFLETSAPEGHEFNLRHCMVIDVFGRVCTSAPRAVSRRRTELQAACREIAMRWPTI